MGLRARAVEVIMILEAPQATHVPASTTNAQATEVPASFPINPQDNTTVFL